MFLHEFCSAGPFFQPGVHIYHGDLVDALNVAQIVQSIAASVKNQQHNLHKGCENVGQCNV